MAADMLVYLVVLVALVADSISDQPCSPVSAHFSMASSRNSNGLWNTLVNMNSSVGPDSNDGTMQKLWTVDVKQTTVKCARGQTVNIVANFTSLPGLVMPGAGYELVPDLGYYKLHSTRMLWSKARQVCHDEGAHLAIVNSEKELKVLHKLLSHETHLGNIAHLGFHQFFEKGQWLTLFGDTLEEAGFSQFAFGQPNAGPNEKCGCFVRNEPLHDCGCTDTLPFICEMELL